MWLMSSRRRVLQAMGNPGERNDNTAFGEDMQRGYHQTAVFLSADYDLIPKGYLPRQPAPVGARYTISRTGRSTSPLLVTLTDVPNGSVF